VRTKITIAQAAQIMNKCQQFVRVGLQRGALPFGTAVKAKERWNYYISPKLFYDYVGELPLSDADEEKGDYIKGAAS